MADKPKKPSLTKIVGWILLVATVGVASCQGFLLEPGENRPGLPSSETGKS